MSENSFVSWVRDSDGVTVESHTRDGYRTVALTVDESMFEKVEQVAEEHEYSYHGAVVKNGVGAVEVFSKDDEGDIQMFIKSLTQ